MKMIKRFTAGIIAAAMALSLMPAFTLTVSAYSGIGTESSPYLISTADDLRQLATDVNGGNGYSGTYFKLTADIDLGGEGNPWTPIGWYNSYSNNNPFNGTFDGNGHKITGLYINASNSNYQGLFGYIDSGTVKKLGVVDAYVTGKSWVGGVAGYIDGTVTDCYNTGLVTGSNYVGGIVGTNSGTVTNCYNTGSVSGSSYVGGVVGVNSYATVTNCYNTGSVSGSSYVGGVVGYIAGYDANDNTFTNIYYLKTNEINATLKAIGSINDGTSEYKGDKTADDFKTLASSLGEAWADSPVVNRPVLKSNPESLYLDNGTYYIPNLASLEWVRDYINDGNGADEYFKLTADIDMSGSYGAEIGDGGTSWTPIGNGINTSANGFQGTAFTGTFDGDNHKITGLYINSNSNYQGLFGYVGKGGTIQNLGVDGSVTVTYLSNAYFGGGVAGYNGGTIANCYNTGIIKGVGGNHIQIGTCVGGVVGLNYGTVTNCYNIGSVSGNAIYVGGVVGDNERSAVTNCYNTGDIKGDGDKQSYVGGVVGYSYSDSNGTSKVQNCYNTGKVTEICSGSTKSAGGVVGRNYSGSRTSAVTNCYNTGSVSGTGDNVGGVAGSNTNGTVTNCYYLDSCGAAGEYGTNKTEAEFNSGEIAWLLQNGQNTQVWGQVLTADKYPILASDSVKKVLKVTFNKVDKTAEYRYTNPNGTVTIPETAAGFAWVKDGSEFTSNTPVTADMTIDAVKKFNVEIEGDIITANGTGKYKDDVASGFVATITSALNKATITKLSVNAGGTERTPRENLPELTIDSGSGIVIGIIIPGITITSASAITFNIE